jgi:hypothetical protein
MKRAGRWPWVLAAALVAAASCATSTTSGPGNPSSSSSGTGGAAGSPSSAPSSTSTGGATTGSGGTGGQTGGAGGAGGGCKTAADCPASTNPCVTVTCTAGACGAANVPMGTVLMPDAQADCMGTVCDGSGNAVKGVDAQNVPTPVNPCLVGTCDMTGTPGTAPASAGTACTSGAGGKLCDGAGACVECLHAADCPNGQACSPTNACLPATCTDSHLDGDETDVDCGGSCLPCGLGKMCFADADCASSACDTQSFTCVADPCDDHRKDGDETDIDCGGSCPSPCVEGQGCAVNADCATDACDALSLTCAASQCSDDHEDGDETDVDCGGSTCTTRCALGKMCKVDADCVAPHACDGISSLCVQSQCTDHRQDGNETDVDCGGADGCARCPAGSKCVINGDCLSGHLCNQATLTCQ